MRFPISIDAVPSWTPLYVDYSNPLFLCCTSESVTDTDLYFQVSFYQNLIPGESDEIFLPPMVTGGKTHSGPRALHVENTETDSAAQAASLFVSPPDFSFINSVSIESNKSISDYIAELKSTQNSKKLNYSRAVQCVSFPAQYKNRKDLEISDVLPTPDGCHILVVLKSVFLNRGGVLLLYSLNFTGKMVKLEEEPMLFRELCGYERPVEVSLLSQLDRVNPDESVSGGTVVIVCTDGAVRVIELSTLRTVSVAKSDSERFVSAAYCNSKYYKLV